MCTLTESPKSKACRLDKSNQRLSSLPGGVQKSRAWRVLLASKVNGASPRQHATAAAIQQNHCLLPAMGALEDRALLLLGRTFKPDQYLPPVRQISGSHEKSNRPGHRAPRCSHSKLQQLPITLAPTQRLLNPLKTHSSNTRNFAVHDQVVGAFWARSGPQRLQRAQGYPASAPPSRRERDDRRSQP